MATTPLVRPVVEPAKITSPYGYRVNPITGQQNSFHSGIDYITAADQGGQWSGDMAVLAICNARVSAVQDGDYDPSQAFVQGSKHSLGRFVYLEAWLHGERYFILYAHLDRVDVQTAQLVGKGERLGIYGSTGAVTGPHLHLGMFTSKWKQANVEKIMIEGLKASGIAGIR